MIVLRGCNLIANHYIEQGRKALIENTKYCVYFITDGNYIKIGIAASIPSRVKQLQTGNPNKLSVMYLIDAKTQIEALRIEQKYHKFFEDKKKLGEWFDITDKDLLNSEKALGHTLKRAISRFDFDVDGIEKIA